MPESSGVPTPRAPRVCTSDWDWLIWDIRMWKVEGDLPTTCDPVGLSCLLPPVPLTGECVGCTIPVLVSRSYTHGEQIGYLETDVGYLQEDLACIHHLKLNIMGVMEDQELYDRSLEQVANHDYEMLVTRVTIKEIDEHR
ncbi:hypothetical protein L1987_32913 [Smallanthus sonchifolius]|uniref:Uncharacterized protein n=1 Tax=Smallanthus sonchifolius TaxID=185202 RepID=A0ACB9HS61_9ASTR|nr:hypothetical protein L1987_32913 [Smallanthus sonchifolius]